jgi:peptidyl-prolyl cis-trans isomerase D
MQPFAETENDTLFVENNFGRIEPTFLSKEELSAAIADTIFKLPVGTVYGPYLDQDAYTCVKLLETATMADSADTRHILIQASTPEDLVKAESRIDSMKTVLEQGAANFDSLAIKFSQDGGSASKGGKYEGITPNTFVPEYNSVLFITGEIGKLYKVKTSFGWHLIEVLKRYGNSKSRARVAYISQPMVPSEETQKAVYNEVYQLVQKSKTIDDLKKVADSRNDLDLTTSPQLKRNDFVLGELGSGQASRDIIRWAFGDDQRLGRSKVGAISPEIYTYRSADNSYDNKYVLAALKSITPKGTPNWKDLREELEPLVINRKKAEIIKAKISGQDLPAIANSFQLKVDTAQGATFGNAFIPGLGAEPRLIGKAFSMEPNAVSAPMEGMAGVYIFKILNKVPAPQAQNAPGVREQLAASTRSSLQGRLLETMTKQANISDSRSRFY